MQIKFTNLNFIPLQVIYDTVARHLLTQAEKAVAANGGCRYRQPRNLDKKPPLMCAVGCLITDDEYQPKMEDKVVSAVIDILKWDNPSFDIDNQRRNLLKRLQMIHDETPPAQWKRALEVAAEYMSCSPPFGQGLRLSLSTAVLHEFPDYEKQFA